MEYVWTPDKELGLTGFVKLKIPTMKEQFQIMRELQVSTDQDGKLKIGEQLDILEKQVEVCRKFVQEVSLVHETSKKEFKEFDELLYFKQTRSIVLVEIANIVLNGVDLGKL